MKLNLALIFIFISLFSIFYSKESRKNLKKQYGGELSLAKIGWELSRPTGQMNRMLKPGYKETDLKDWKYVIGVPYTNPDTLVIVIRGTALNWNNIKADIKTGFVPITTIKGECDKCNVSSGFKEGYETIKKNLSADFGQQYSANKGIISQIFATGHSMGGALATICAYNLSLSFKKLGYTEKLSLITFGSPRVGNLNFVTYINNNAGLQYNVRITYNQDPIPDYPGLTDKDDEANSKYIHVGTEVNFLNPTNYNVKKFKADERIKAGVMSFLSGLHSKFDQHKLYYTIDNRKLNEALMQASRGMHGKL